MSDHISPDAVHQLAADLDAVPHLSGHASDQQHNQQPEGAATAAADEHPAIKNDMAGASTDDKQSDDAVTHEDRPAVSGRAATVESDIESSDEDDADTDTDPDTDNDVAMPSAPAAAPAPAPFTIRLPSKWTIYHFYAINPAVYPEFNHNIPELLQFPDLDQVQIRVGHKELNVHRIILIRTAMLDNQPKDTSDLCILSDKFSKLRPWLLFIQVLYDARFSIDTFEPGVGPDLVEALQIAQTYDADLAIQKHLTHLIKKYYQLIAKYWQKLPLNGMTNKFHEGIMKDVNSAWLAYSSSGLAKPFPSDAFATLLIMRTTYSIWREFSREIDLHLQSTMLRYQMAQREEPLWSPQLDYLLRED